MRLVLDTNVVVAGLLWQGPPRHLLAATIERRVRCFTSSALTDELGRVLRYPKFAARIALYHVTPNELLHRYLQLTEMVSPAPLPKPVARDSDDDHVLACALAARARLIVSGDSDLIELEEYEGVVVVTPAEALRIITER